MSVDAERPSYELIICFSNESEPGERVINIKRCYTYHNLHNLPFYQSGVFRRLGGIGGG